MGRADLHLVEDAAEGAHALCSSASVDGAGVAEDEHAPAVDVLHLCREGGRRSGPSEGGVESHRVEFARGAAGHSCSQVEFYAHLLLGGRSLASGSDLLGIGQCAAETPAMATSPGSYRTTI